jgi:hypothetical protein
MANERGTYGKPLIGAAPSGQGGSSLGTWIVGGLLVGGAALWARHQSVQVAKLYKATGLPQQSFTASLREDARALPAAARGGFHAVRAKLHDLTSDPRKKKEVESL